IWGVGDESSAILEKARQRARLSIGNKQRRSAARRSNWPKCEVASVGTPFAEVIGTLCVSEVCLICVYGPAIARGGFKYDQAPWSFLEGVTFNDSNPGGIGSPTENSARKREHLSYQATVGIDFRVVKDVPCLIRCPLWPLVAGELSQALIHSRDDVHHAYVPRNG